MPDSSHLPVIPEARVDDLHHLDTLEASQLNLFMAGNQFMVMPELIAAFKQSHPDIQHIYCQTLPPGLQLKQILAGGALFGGRDITAGADVYTSVSKNAMQQLAAAGMTGPGSWHVYLHNRLALLVPQGNPAGIKQIADLGRDRVRISQPDPQNEDIAFHIIQMYRDAGGQVLAQRIMEEKRAEGTTVMTVVHHRETPLRLLKGTVDVGPVWATEAVHAAREKLALEMIDPGPELDQRQRINYYICALNTAPHPDNARAFVEFVDSDPARRIFENYGFVAPY